MRARQESEYRNYPTPTSPTSSGNSLEPMVVSMRRAPHVLKPASALLLALFGNWSFAVPTSVRPYLRYYHASRKCLKPHLAPTH